MRAKIVALLVAASLLPLGITNWISVENARKDEYETTERLLHSRAQMLARRIDALNGAYSRIANLLALASPTAVPQVQGTGEEARRVRALVRGQLGFWTQIDSNIRGAALLDADGRVLVSTEPPLEGTDMSGMGFVREALAGNALVSDIFQATPPLGEVPSVGYLAPIHAADGSRIGVAAIWVRTAQLEQLLREVNGDVGEGSFAVLIDSLGIRIAHSNNPEGTFRPIQPLEPATVAALEAEQRFGARTREQVTDVAPITWEPALPFREMPDAGMFRARGMTGEWVRSVGHRCNSVAWTVFFQVPERVLEADAARVVRNKLLFAIPVMVITLGFGVLFAAAIVRPVRRLAAGAHELGGGNLAARVEVDRGDELGELGTSFNAMAARIQQQSEQLQRESADQYRKLFQTMSEGFCSIEMMFDDAGNPVDFVYLEANSEFERHSGLHDVVGKRKSEVVPDLEERWMQAYAQVVRTGEPIEFEDEGPNAGRFYHVRAYRVGGPDSRRVAVLFDDITERKLAQRRQQSQLETLNLLHQITRAIGERQDLPSIFQVVLRSIEEHLHVDFGCVLLYLPALNQLEVACIGERSRALAGSVSLHEQQQVAIDPNGLSRCVRGQLVYEPDLHEVQFPFPQRLAAGGLSSMVAAPLLVENRVFGVLVATRTDRGFSSGECEFLRQLSEHVALAAHHAQLYAALQEAYDDLRATQQAAMQQERLRALGQMASGIAHDINNAISPVALYADSLLEREQGLSGAGRGQLQTIRRAIDDVAATVARMREFYREREPLHSLSPVQLNELVPQVVELTRARWDTMALQRGITIALRTELQPELPAILGADNEIREALTNLVFNAVDAMPEGGVLTLRTGTDADGSVFVEARDTGVGMDEDSRRRCLEPFFTTKGERGTGLGLAMVYGMAQRHSAAIAIESAPGQGTCVRLAFSPAGAMAAQVEEETPPHVPGGLRILVIDDDPVLRRSLGEILEHEGHAVFVAAGGQEGIAMAREALDEGHAFSVVITDLGMPYVDGRMVARALRAMAPRMPVVMLTGWGERLVSDGNVPSDVDLVLSKPPRLRALREALARLCSGVEPAG